MDTYAAAGAVAAVAVSPGKTALGLLAAPTVRAKVHYFVLSVGGVPVMDNILEWQIRRFQGDGTRTALVPTLMDPAAPASLVVTGQNYTVEPTYAANFLFDIAVHQRSLYQWNAAPGREIVIPVTAGQGMGFTPIHASYASTATALTHWQE